LRFLRAKRRQQRAGMSFADRAFMTKLTTFRNLTTLLLILPLAGCGSTSDQEPGVERDIGESESHLYYESDLVWDDPSISVCWLWSAGATERGWVQAAVESAIEPFSAVNFTGWGLCNGTAAEVVIDNSSSNWPGTNLGARSPSTLPNMRLNHFIGAARDVSNPPDGNVDFLNCWTDTPASANPVTGITGRSWTSNHRRCVEVIAVHEFFHVLAVAHEQNRSDTPSTCTQDDDGRGDTEYGYWDYTSISNGCNPAWDGDGYPSPLDYSWLAELYGADTNDRVWYGIGSLRDYGSVDSDRLMFAPRQEDISGTYVPIIGDFDGDLKDDLFLYGPGGAHDELWFGRSDRDWDETAQNVTGTYQPVAGDFDGDGKDDIFWHVPGSGADKLAFGRVDRSFDNTTPANVTGTYTKPLAGDFDGDGKDDIFWYVSGSAADKISFGRSDRTFDNVTPENISGVYEPFVGDFDADGRDDIFLYRPGTASDSIWFGNVSRTFTSVSKSVTGTYSPGVGDFDGDGAADVIWSESGEIDTVHLFSPTTRAAIVTTATSSILGSNTPGGESKPYAGDFDGDGISDVLWYKPN
jgi:hypothetical protein